LTACFSSMCQQETYLHCACIHSSISCISVQCERS
jgi:hypothetical protein